ncbi:MAG: M20/M25/M40 family metallo-hydrolase [Saprospiraceae bacterium]|nr:M20/M25/M40 family metallo-hydrolase [Saprospiraceae bacterium]
MDAIELLKRLISISSPSREEHQTADLIASELSTLPGDHLRIGNNVVAMYEHKPNAPWVLLCSHHDTVKPNQGYTRDPHDAIEDEGRIYGLGSNDAGGAMVAMMHCYRELTSHYQLSYNLGIAAAAEEEISGANGIGSVLSSLPNIHLGVVGEPTSGQAAVAEKGLMVIDGKAQGTAGHAAHHRGDSAILMAGRDIERIHGMPFHRVSPALGLTKATVCQLEAGQQHNQMPSQCEFVIDVRTNDLYSNEEVFQKLQEVCESTLVARSYRLQPSRLASHHPFYKLLVQHGIPTYGSPTLSDQALMPFDTVKIGPGDSRRSHTADEYILRDEIEAGIALYLKLLKNYQP